MCPEDPAPPEVQFPLHTRVTKMVTSLLNGHLLEHILLFAHPLNLPDLLQEPLPQLEQLLLAPRSVDLHLGLLPLLEGN